MVEWEKALREVRWGRKRAKVDPCSQLWYEVQGDERNEENVEKKVRALQRFRAGAYAVMATLPSNMAHLSNQGTYLARKRLLESRRSRKYPKESVNTAEGQDSRDSAEDDTVRSRKIGPYDVDLLGEAEQRGLKMDYSMDGSYDALDRMKQLEIIRQMPISISSKQALRNKLYEYMPDIEKGDCCQTYWYKQKLNRMRCSQKMGIWYNELMATATLWRGSFKLIEGHFGSGVLTYFKFLKWLFMLNTGIFLTMFIFVCIPQLAFPARDYTAYDVTNVNITPAQERSIKCSKKYSVFVDWSDFQQLCLDFLQGTGWMEKSIMFYGYYSEKIMDIAGIHNYNMPLAYSLTVIIYFILSLVMMVSHTATGFRSRLFVQGQQYKQYCNSVFAGWDYSLNDYTNSTWRVKSIWRGLTGALEEERSNLRRKQRKLGQRIKVWTVRLIINLLVIAILGGAGYLIYFTIGKELELKHVTGLGKITELLIGYMTSLTITLLNGLIPIVFTKMVTFEHYSPAFDANITLVRTVFLRLASLAVLISTIYKEISCSPKDECNVGDTAKCSAMRCWETYVGQELYKLVIMDFLSVFAVIFCYEFLRKFIVKKCDCKIIRLVGYQEFDIPKNVLDLIYSQTLLWLGTFFAPIIAGMCVIKFFLLFYLKMLSCLINFQPSSKPYRASDSQSFFMIVLIVAYLLCSIPIIFVLWRIPPSPGCGPFRTYQYMSEIIPVTIATGPAWLQQTFTFIGSAAVIIPIFIILILAIYYMNTMLNSFKDMMRLLKEQLAMEGQDKQFLLAKLQQLESGKPAKRGVIKRTISTESIEKATTPSCKDTASV